MAPFKEISWKRAEKIAGHRVDRRRKYGFDGQELVESITFTEACSGCFEGGEYMGLAHNYEWDEKHHCHIGGGCSECGYTGKRRTTMWVPYVSAEVARKAA